MDLATLNDKPAYCVYTLCPRFLEKNHKPMAWCIFQPLQAFALWSTVCVYSLGDFPVAVPAFSPDDRVHLQRPQKISRQQPSLCVSGRCLLFRSISFPGPIVNSRSFSIFYQTTFFSQWEVSLQCSLKFTNSLVSKSNTILKMLLKCELGRWLSSYWGSSNHMVAHTHL